MRCPCAAFVTIALAACGVAGDRNANEAAEQASLVPGDRRVECATSGSPRFQRLCTVEQIAADGGTVLIVRNPDGGFRRLLVTGDGRGVIAADGAEPAIVKPRGASEIEVAIGRDRYRLPATVRGVTP